MRDAGRVLESLLVERCLQTLRRAPSEHWTLSFWDSPVGGLWGLRREPVESQIFWRREPRLHPGVKLSRMQFKFLVWSSWSPWWSVEWENPDFLRMVFFFPRCHPSPLLVLRPLSGASHAPHPAESKQRARACSTRKLSTSLTLHSMGQGASFFNAGLCSMICWVYRPHEPNLVQSPILEQIFLQMVIFQPPASPIPFSSQLCWPLRLVSAWAPC